VAVGGIVLVPALAFPLRLFPKLGLSPVDLRDRAQRWRFGRWIQPGFEGGGRSPAPGEEWEEPRGEAVGQGLEGGLAAGGHPCGSVSAVGLPLRRWPRRLRHREWGTAAWGSPARSCQGCWDLGTLGGARWDGM